MDLKLNISLYDNDIHKKDNVPKRDGLIEEFKSHSKHHEVLIVGIDDKEKPDYTEWLIAGYNTKGKFEKVILDSTENKLIRLLKKAQSEENKYKNNCRKLSEIDDAQERELTQEKLTSKFEAMHQSIKNASVVLTTKYINASRYIENPDFAFIFTVSLDGKFDISEQIVAEHKKGCTKTNRKNNEIKYRLPRTTYYEEKDKIFYNLLNGDCNECRREGKCATGIPPFVYEPIKEKELGNFISPAFINKSVLGTWGFTTGHDDSRNKLFIKALKRYYEEGGHVYTEIKNNPPILNEEYFEKTYIYSKNYDTMEPICVEDIHHFTQTLSVFVTLFSTGSLSIRVETQPETAVRLHPDQIIHLIKFPNLAIDRRDLTINQHCEVQRRKESTDKYHPRKVSGFLNIYTHELAGHVFNDFFTCLKDPKHKEYADILHITRIKPETTKDHNLLSDRYSLGEYTKKEVMVEIQHVPDLSDFSEQVSYYEKRDRKYLIYKGDLLDSDKKKIYESYKYTSHPNANKTKTTEEKRKLLESLAMMFSILSRNICENQDDCPLKDNESMNCPLLKDETFKNLLEDSIELTPANKEDKRKEILSKTCEHYGSLWKGPLYVHPYIAIKFNKFPPGNKYIKKDVLSDHAIRVLTAIVTQTYALEEHLNIPGADDNNSDYLLRRSISRGNQDAIFVEKRALIVAGNRDKSRALDTPYHSILFCMESIFATQKSVSNFNKELEENISWRINNMLTDANVTQWQYFKPNIPQWFIIGCAVLSIVDCCVPLWIEAEHIVMSICIAAFFTAVYCTSPLFVEFRYIAKFWELLNRARTLSPCEDFSSNIEPSLKSESAYKASEIAKGFGLNILVDTVHNRMDNYGHFLKNHHASLNSKITLAFTIMILLATGAGIYIGIDRHNKKKHERDRTTIVKMVSSCFDHTPNDEPTDTDPIETSNPNEEPPDISAQKATKKVMSSEKPKGYQKWEDNEIDLIRH